jgi:hypothetical protein
MRLPFGQFKGKDFANTIGPWIVTPDEIEAHGSGDRLDLDMRASLNGTELGSDTLAKWRGASRSSWRTPRAAPGSRPVTLIG